MIPSARVLPSSLIALLLTSLVSARPYPASPLEERAGSPEATAWGDIPEGTELISYWPRITTPVEGQVWQEGSSVQISWNGTAPPYAPNQISQEADVVLGYLSDTSAGYHLDINNPLASVQLYTEPYSINITLPTNLTTRKSYLLILGSSANSSPLFTIEGTGPADNASASSSSAAAASTTSKAIAARPTTYIVGGQTTVLGQSSNIAAPVVSASQSQGSFSDGNGGATVSSSASAATSTNTPYNSSLTQGPLAGAIPAESSAESATPAFSSSSSSVVLASQEQTGAVTASSASAKPTSAAISLKASSWVVMAVGGALGLSLLL